MKDRKLPEYSVLMSLYINERADYLQEAIESILNQTVPPEEIVIVEDGPLSDELYEVVNSYVERYPKLFQIVLCEENVGLGLALNKGLEKCKNEFVARMDTDDISKPDRCEQQLIEMSEAPELTIIGTYVDEFLNDINNVVSVRKVPLEHEDIYRYARRRSAFNHPTVMYRKSRVLAMGGYANLRRNQDVDLFGRMLYNGYKAKNIGKSLLWFRSNDMLASRRKSWTNTKSYIKTIGRFWKMGYANCLDFLIVAFAQTLMFILPIKAQMWVYKKFLRK